MATKRVQLIRVGDRDCWVCHLCLGAVDELLYYPHLMAGTLDHLVPTGMVGTRRRPAEDTDDFDLALAHYICNSWRGNAELGEARAKRVGWRPGDKAECLESRQYGICA